jgi:hypothetical protein
MRNLILLASLASVVLRAASGSDEYRISGAYTHDNLSVFLIHGSSSGKRYLPLKEALELKKVVVYETQNVNELAIENLSDSDVFVEGGDIVKGGQQDRVLGNDFVIPAKSGRVPISAFCVEPGRWNQRGLESVQVFGSSTETVGNKEMALAVKTKKDQGEVWKEVAKARDALGSGGGSGGGFGVGGGIAGDTPHRAFATQVDGAALSSSLQLTLESKAVTDAVEGYIKALLGVADGQPDVVGFAFAVNGKINSADTYASAELFRAMWPKLLKASAVEAVRAGRKDQEFSPASASAVEAILKKQEGATTSTVKAQRVTLISRDSDQETMFESRDRDGWIHRNYIPK